MAKVSHHCVECGNEVVGEEVCPAHPNAEITSTLSPGPKPVRWKHTHTILRNSVEIEVCKETHGGLDYECAWTREEWQNEERAQWATLDGVWHFQGQPVDNSVTITAVG